MAHKIEVAEDLNQPYAPPADATLDQLREIQQSAHETALELLNKDNPSDEDILKATWLSGAIDVIDGAAAGLEQAEQEKKAALDELKSKFKPADPQADADVAGQIDAAAPAAAEPAVVAAALPSIGQIARTVPRPVVTEPSKAPYTLTAAADLPGFTNGQALDADSLGDAFEARARSYPSLRGQEAVVKHGIARLDIPFEESLVASGDNYKSIKAALKRATDQSQLPEGNILAAGWCAPSEVLYPLLDMTTADGLVSVPEIAVERGGVKWTTGPNFGAVYAQGMASLSETQMIANTTKSAYNVPCPAFSEQRLNADYLFLTADILSERGYPEMIADFIGKAQKAFLHFESGKTIADIAAGSQSVDMTASTGAPNQDIGAVATILGFAELQATDIKYRSRLGLGTEVELILPLFAKGIMRSDLMKRQGISAADADIADSEIAQLFANRGIAVQYVYDWQDNIVTGGSGNPMGAVAASGDVTSWPQTILGLMYPAGTWAKAVVPVIELSTMYDYTLLQSNQYVGLFQEQGRLTINRGFDSRKIKFYSNPSGLTSGYVAQTHPAAATPF